MSTNKTTNYQLHLWEPEDDFLREEFNENSTKTDAALAAHDKDIAARLRIVSGSYTGSGGSSKTIDFGVEAMVAFLVPDSSTPGDYPAVIIRGQSAGNVSEFSTNSHYHFSCVWSGTSLTITSQSNVTLNRQAVRYRWIAIY